MFSVEEDLMAKHSAEWDSTFEDARVLEKLSDDNNALVHLKFAASPLSSREMLCVVHRHEEGPPSTPQCKNEKKEGGADGDVGGGVGDDWVLWLTFAYASVGDKWTREEGTQRERNQS